MDYYGFNIQTNDLCSPSSFRAEKTEVLSEDLLQVMKR